MAREGCSEEVTLEQRSPRRRWSGPGAWPFDCPGGQTGWSGAERGEEVGLVRAGDRERARLQGVFRPQ